MKVWELKWALRDVPDYMEVITFYQEGGMDSVGPIETAEVREFLKIGVEKTGNPDEWKEIDGPGWTKEKKELAKKVRAFYIR